MDAEPVDLNELVFEMEWLMRNSVGDAVSLSRSLAPALPPVHGDRARLRQVLLNLVVNGSEAIGASTGESGIRTPRWFS